MSPLLSLLTVIFYAVPLLTGLYAVLVFSKAIKDDHALPFVGVSMIIEGAASMSLGLFGGDQVAFLGTSRGLTAVGLMLSSVGVLPLLSWFDWRDFISDSRDRKPCQNGPEERPAG